MVETKCWVVFTRGAFDAGLKSGFFAEKLIGLILVKNYAEAFGREYASETEFINICWQAGRKFLGRQPLIYWESGEGGAKQVV